MNTLDIKGLLLNKILLFSFIIIILIKIYIKNIYIYNITMQSIFEKNNKYYTNAKIYQVLNNINNKVYVGGTCQILRKRMDVHRHYSVNRDGLIYEEMRRVGQKHFYIELIENYQCNNKEELILKLNSYIRERGTLNDRINTHVVEQIDVKPVILELKKMVLDMHIQLNNIEYKINTLLNTSYTSEASTSYDGDNEVSSNSKTSLKHSINSK